MISIHYNLALPEGTPLDTVADTINSLRQLALLLPVVEVTQVMILTTERIRSMDADPDASAPFQLRRTVSGPDPRDPDSVLPNDLITVWPERVLAVGVQPVSDGQPLHLLLGTYPAMVRDAYGHDVPTDLPGWQGQGVWTWRDEHGHDPDVVLSHLMVIALLEAARQLGLSVTVSDDSGFWRSRRLSSIGGIPRPGIDPDWSPEDLETLRNLAVLVDAEEVQPDHTPSGPGDGQRLTPIHPKET